MNKKQFDEAKYITLLKNAKKVRHYVAEHPGVTYRELHFHFKQGEGFDPPIMWLLLKRYVVRKRTTAGIMGYFIRPIEKLRDVEPEEQNDDQQDSEVDTSPEALGISRESEV